jgi:dipeptidyl aminopeptidase/acylaminoacyl peptidase
MKTKNPSMTSKLMLLLFLFAFSLTAQLDLPYQQPVPEILALADVPLPPRVMLSHTVDLAVMIYRPAYQSIEELSQPEMRLAGLRISPRTTASSRLRYVDRLGVLTLSSGEERIVTGLPEKPRLAYFTWSPDQKRLAFTHTGEAGLELWVLDLDTARARRLTPDLLSGALGMPFTWFSDGSAILVKTRPADRQPLIDTEAALPKGPTVSVNDGQKAQNMTFQDLLRNRDDEFNFEQLVRSELQRVSLDGRISPWKEAAMYTGVSVSPDGRYVLVSAIRRPFSYMVPLSRFPFDTEICDQNGMRVKMILEVPLQEVLPKGNMAERTGMRDLGWREDRGAALYWAEVLDGGDPKAKAEYRDELFTLEAPFTGKKRSLLRMRGRLAGVTWGGDHLAVVSEYWWDTRNTKTHLIDPAAGPSRTRIIFDRNYQDRYADPGQFVTGPNRFGRDVLLTEGADLFLLGDGFSPDGVRPFVDRFNTRSRKVERMWQADGRETLEEIIDFRDVRQGLLLTRIQAKDRYPNLYFRRIGQGDPQPITRFENPFAPLASVHKEVVSYKRDDGLDLSGTLYLPLGYEKGQRYPMIMWAYPQEFKDRATAGQVTASPHEFIYPHYGSPLYWLTRGYVVLDDAAFPIVGEGKVEPNDTFIRQLVANAKAAIDALDAKGIVDPRRVAVGGHSYGAFMTANLLSHSDLFAAGIARSGAYNRSLTPFGFQSEERHYWEAPTVYTQMSPFMHADRMKTPLLLIHGAADNNPGTHTQQSERYFNALKGLGATVRLVLLPKESHGYAARESVLHVLWEQDQWLERYVKNRPAGE